MFLRQPGRFAAEHEHIPRLETDVRHAALRMRGQRVDAGRPGARVGQGLLQRIVHADRLPFVVIQPRAAHAGVVQFETQGTDQMQLGAGIGAQADGVAGIGRNLGADENDVEHGGWGSADSWRRGWP
ncbi:hypothetical protein D9M69_668830 [compost metagenome]